MAAFNASSIAENFGAFFNSWLVRQENLHERLVQALRLHDEGLFEDSENLIQEVLSHYEQYLMEKSKAAREEVLFFYSPPWLTSFEKTLLWVGGFKPFLLFKILAKSVTELNPEQEQDIERIKYETRREERELTETSATIQESLAGLPLLNLVRRCGRAVDGEESDLIFSDGYFHTLQCFTEPRLTSNFVNQIANKMHEKLCQNRLIKKLDDCLEDRVSSGGKRRWCRERRWKREEETVTALSLDFRFGEGKK